MKGISESSPHSGSGSGKGPSERRGQKEQEAQWNFPGTPLKSRAQLPGMLDNHPGALQMQELPPFEFVLTFEIGGSALCQGETMLCAAQRMRLY